MLLGMNAGAWLAARAGGALPVEAAVLAAHGLMLGGMLAGAALAQCLTPAAGAARSVRPTTLPATQA